MQKQRYRMPMCVIIGLALVSSLLMSACGAASNSESPLNLAREISAPSEGSMAMLVAPGAANEQVAGLQAVQATGDLARKVVAQATMNLVVDNAEQVVTEIQQMMNAVGGYVANANLYKSEYGVDTRLQGTLTLRVPADQLETVMAQLEALAVDVNNKTINREDVTDQYSDVEAQLRNLEAAEVELRAMLAEVRAKPNAKPDDILTVYNQLSSIRSQIEQLQGRKNMLDNLVSLSRLDLTLSPNVVTLPVVEEGWQPAIVARDSLRTLVTTLQGLGNIAIWGVIYLLPVLLILFLAGMIVFGALRTIWRRFIRRRPTTA